MFDDVKTISINNMPSQGQLKCNLLFEYYTYKLSSVFEHLLPIVILRVKLLQEPFAFVCKNKQKHLGTIKDSL